MSSVSNPTSGSPTVSCVIPVRNGERYLREALDSVLAQSSTPIEIVVVDDGSTDGTAALVREYGTSVVYVFQEQAGVSAARNRGIAASSGALIAFLDSDDRWMPEKIEVQLKHFQECSNLDLSRAFAQGFWSEELSAAEREADSRYGDLRYDGRVQGQIITWLVRRDIFDRIGLFDETRQFLEDVEWFTRARDANIEVATLDRTLAERRLHPRNTTLGQTREGMSDLADVLKAHLDRMRSRE